MKFLFEFFPILVFFAVFKFAGIFAATASAIAVAGVQMFVSLLRRGAVEKALWVNAAIIALFGGATLFFHNEWFIKWKPTVLYALFAGILFGAEFLFGKNIIRLMIGENLSLPEQVWRWMNHAWALFFAFLGVANIFVAYRFSTEAWVNFKLFGIVGLMLAFVFVQGFFLMKYVQETEGGK